MKALLRVVLQREIKKGRVAKLQVFLLLYHLVKRFAIVSITRNLIVNHLLNLKKTTFWRFSIVAVTPQGMFDQDGDSSQNSKAAKTALDEIGAVQFSIPPHSLDLHPIENVFSLVEKKLGSDAVKYPISKESYAKLVERVENTLLSYPI